MTFFDMLRTLFFNRRESTYILDTESQTHFVPFLLNRWLSFYDRDRCILVNETINKYTGIFEDKHDLFKLYYKLLPVLKFKKIEYIKKKKESSNEEEKYNISLIAKNKNISKREILMYLDLQKSEIK